MSRIPDFVLEQIRVLENELADGDLTVQGFEKKKKKILAPYLTDEGGGTSGGGGTPGGGAAPSSPPDGGGRPTSPPHAVTPSTVHGLAVAIERGLQRSPSSDFIHPTQLQSGEQAAEARVVAVQKATERAQENPIPMSYRRNTGMPQPQIIMPAQVVPSPDEGNPASAASRTPPPQYPKPTGKVLGPPVLPRDPALLSPSSKGGSPIVARHKREGSASSIGSHGSLKRGTTTASAAMETEIESSPKPPLAGRMVAGGARGGVSNKIQQLLNTLKRPKKSRKAMEEYYQDDSQELTPQEDPNAPKPVGPAMLPVSGVPLENRPEWHRNIEAAIQHYSVSKGRQPAISVVDTHGKFTVQLTYEKLAAKALKIAHFLLHKLGGGKVIQPGDRVALIYSVNEPAAFATAFYGCIFACVVPIAIDPPITKEDPGGQHVGFLLNSLRVSVALTSDTTAKNLPKDDSKDHIVQFKGWPRLVWCLTEHLPKPPKDWTPPQRPQPESDCYAEMTMSKDGSAALGATVTRQGLIAHCKVLSTACLYKENDLAICTEDPKTSIGLWHGVMTSVYNGMHVIFIPPSVFAAQPSSWIQIAYKFKATCVFSSSRALAGCIQMAGHKEMNNINLETIRMLLLSDGANPWSLATSDAFIEAFVPKGLRKEAMCPCAGSPEALTVSLRRPIRSGPATTGRGVMSIYGLSHGVVRVEEAGAMTSLTLQDVGLVMPGATVVVVKLKDAPILCRTDEVGEICVHSTASASSYYRLQGRTAHTFQVTPVDENNKEIGNAKFIRTGLLGFVGTGGMVFVCGTIDGLIQISGRRHNTEDLIATVLAVEPHTFVYKGRVALFAVTVYHDERVVVVAEQKPHCSDEEAFKWMNGVLPAVEAIHGISLYGIVLVGAGRLPKNPTGVVQIHETRQRFLEGTLHPLNVLMCPNQCIQNLPVPKSHSAAVTGAAMMIGDLVTGRSADNTGSGGGGVSVPLQEMDDPGKFQSVSDMLRWRSQSQGETVLYSLMDAKGHVAQKLTAAVLHKRAERLAYVMKERFKPAHGEHMALLYTPSLDLIVAFHACLFVGVVPVIIRPPSAQNVSSALPTIKLTLEMSQARAVLTTSLVVRLLKSKEAASFVDPKTFPPILDTDDTPRKKFEDYYKVPTTELIAYLDFSVSTTGVLSGIKVSHASLRSLCQALKCSAELYPSREIVLCSDPYSGLGLALWCLASVYLGHHTYLINPYDLETNPALWMSTVSQYKVRDTYCTYAVLTLCLKELCNSIPTLKSKGIDLSCLRNCICISEERPRHSLLMSFGHLFHQLGLSQRAVSASFSCKVNNGVCLQGAQHPDPETLYVDQRALRVDRVTVLERGSPNSIPIMECGKIMPGVKVAIVNPDNKMFCANTDLGEIWVSSGHNGTGYYGLGEEMNDAVSLEHFHATSNSDPGVVYARTGYLGFMQKSDKPNQDGTYNHCLFVVGSREESMNIRGFRYHPVDLETTVIRSHRFVTECAVFTWTKLLVVVAEIKGSETDALDLVPVITTALLEEQQVIVGIVVLVDPGSIPINARGEKQRMHLRDSFLNDELDPIYVAYNL